MRDNYGFKLILTFIICICICISPMTTVFANEVYSFNYAGGLSKEGIDNQDAIYYTDSYFEVPSTTYQPKLATASCCLAFAGFGSNAMYRTTPPSYSQSPVNLLSLMKSLSFTNIEIADYYTQTPRADSIAYGFGYKLITIKDETGADTTIPLVVVGIRGANYRSEWVSNTTVGINGNHSGFESASMQVLTALKAYIQEHEDLNGQDIKLWISGFSRAGAVSNVSGGFINDAIFQGNTHSLLSANISQDDLYIYTFEAPPPTIESDAHSDKYRNIFNVVNPNDLVPLLSISPDAEATFVRYGIDKKLISSTTSNKFTEIEEQVKAIYNKIYNTTYIQDKFRYSALNLPPLINSLFKIETHDTQSEFLQHFSHKLSENLIGKRGIYIDNYQKAMQILLSFYYSDSKYTQSAQYNLFLDYLKNNSGAYFLETVSVITTKTVDHWPDTLAKSFHNLLKDAQTHSNLTLSQNHDQFENLENSFKIVVNNLLHDQENLLELLNTLFEGITFSSNIQGIIQAHTPGLCISWLKIMDENYVGDAALSPDDVFVTNAHPAPSF